MIQKSMKTDDLSDFLLVIFFSSFLTLKNQGFSKFSQNLKAGDLAISVVYLQMLHPDWQAAAPSPVAT